MTTTTPALRCTGLTKRFDGLTALDRLDLEVTAGTVYGYLGPNGAGKTTTIRLLLGLSRPTAGQVEVLGGAPADPRTRSRVGYLPGELRLDERTTARELLDHWARLRGGVDRAHRAGLVERLGLDESRPVHHLSTGNRRKVGLVGAFMSRPDLLVLDEPTNGLDPLVQAEFLAMVTEARDDGATVFLSSHVLSEVQRVADRVAVLRQGSLAVENTVDELRHEARQRFDVHFDGPAPVDRLTALDGVADLKVDDGHATWTAVGPLQPVLAVLANSRVRTLIAPEPDLEDAFFAVYHDHAPDHRPAPPAPPAGPIPPSQRPAPVTDAREGA